MKRLLQFIFIFATPLVLAISSDATVLLDQTSWTTSARTSQRLPTNSAWFASSSGSLTVSSSALRMIVGTSSGMAITYFTATSNSPPVTLNVGDTLTTSITFTFGAVPPNGSMSQGFKVGVFDFADGSNVPLRVTADGGFSSSSQGTFVEGYALFGKMYGTFFDNQPIDIRKRTVVSDTALLSASGDWTSIEKGQLNTNSFDGFANANNYMFQLIYQRTSLYSLVVTEIWSNMVSGATLSDSTVDNLATNFSFDGIAFRPSSNTEAPATNLFKEVSVVVTSAPVAPSIISDPQSLTVNSGQSPSFTSVVNGTLPMFYQWYNTTNPVGSASTVVFPPAHNLIPNPSLTITNAQSSDAGSYFIVISNSYGSATSQVASLTVNLAPPTIATQPQDLTVIPGQYATFSVEALGSEPFTYLWYYNTSTLLTNATGASLTLTNVQPSDAGSYSVIVSNPLGSVTSSNAVLTVNTNPSAPVFIAQPASITVRVGDSASFTAAAVGTTPISYQWNTNGFPIPGATSTTLNLSGVQLTDAATYTIVASNSIGSTTSSNAILTVNPRTPPLPVIPTNQFNILNFGAYGDGISNSATSIQNTINAAAAAGGGIVVVPTNGSLNTYMCGPLVLSNSINLQINAGATLKMLPRFANASVTNWPTPSLPPFISANGANDIAITGSGTIEGNAGFGSTNWWQSPTLDTSLRPHMIDFGGTCTRVLIQGVTLQNPPTFHIVLKGNNVSVTIQNIYENTPGNSPNTDGMDLASTNMLIQNCVINDGDDNIEIGGSGGPAVDIVISNCTFGVGHGVSIGSQIQGGVSELIVSNCTFNGTDNGIRLKSDRTEGGLVQNLKYCDLTMTNVGYPLIIYSFYDSVGTPNNISPSTAAADGPQPVIDTTPIWQNILISNVTATSSTGSGITGIIWGKQEMVVSNVVLCKVSFSSGLANSFDVYNARGIQILDSNVTATNATGNTLNLYNAEIIVTNTVASANLVTLGGLTRVGTNNAMSFFNSQAVITDTNMVGASPITMGASTLAFSESSVSLSNSFSVVDTSTLAFTSGNNTLRGPLTGNGPLTLNLPANSSLTLPGDNSSFGGALVVSNSGTLLVNNATGSGTGTGAVTVVSGATLGGTGFISGPVTVSGILAPGNGPGTLTISNNLVLNGGAVLQYDLGTNSDQTVVSGNLTLAGTLNVANSGGFTDSTYILLTYGGALTYNGVGIGSAPAGFNYAINTSTAGQVNLVVSPPLTAFQQWQITYFGSTTNAEAAPSADPDGDGQDNMAEFLSGTNPTNSASGLRIISATLQSTNVVIKWTTAGGFTNAVQATAGNGNSGFTNTFVDISGPIIISGSGDVTTNYTDFGGATNTPSRFYRIRLVP